jgi:beta-galactosidase
MVHILPHWNWPERLGKITPVHIITSGDEVELFLNDVSLGKKKKGEYEYRLRWDDVLYEPGELKAVAYKNGKIWAEKIMKTTGEPTILKAEADRDIIKADGKDLSFITVQITDNEGNFIANANNKIEFSIEGPGEIVATDNGDPSDLIPFPSNDRKAFSGLALAIIRSHKGEQGTIKITLRSEGLEEFVVLIKSK